MVAIRELAKPIDVLGVESIATNFLKLKMLIELAGSDNKRNDYGCLTNVVNALDETPIEAIRKMIR